MSEESSLIGKKVRFSIKPQTSEIGRIVDRVTMKEKPEDQVTITGYIICVEGDSLKLHSNVAHWRLREIIG